MTPSISVPGAIKSSTAEKHVFLREVIDSAI